MLKVMTFLASLAIVFSSFAQTGITPISNGTLLPMSDHAMKNINGEEKTLKDAVAENGLIVIFSSNTCPFVVGGENYPGWEKDYNDLHQLANQNGINLVLVNSNEAKRESGESWEDMKARAAEKGYRMQYLYDNGHVVADAFGAKTTPHVFLFDASGKLIYSGSIDNTWDSSRKKDEFYLKRTIEVVGSGKGKINPEVTPAKGCSIKRK
jgi:thioredoxin-related protein